jgi:hypothetical protein
VSERDVVALSAPDYVSTSRDVDLWCEAASGGGGEASAWSQLAGLGLSRRQLLPVRKTDLGVAPLRTTADQIARKASPSLKRGPRHQRLEGIGAGERTKPVPLELQLAAIGEAVLLTTRVGHPFSDNTKRVDGQRYTSLAALKQQPQTTAETLTVQECALTARVVIPR